MFCCRECLWYKAMPLCMSIASQNCTCKVAVKLSACAGIGLYNIIHWYPPILKAFSPTFWFSFLLRNGNDGWVKLGGVVLCITGAPTHLKFVSEPTYFMCG